MGWVFDKDDKCSVTGIPYEDSLYGLKCMKDLYKKAQPEYDGRITVPVLWDKKTEQIVNNESSEIIKILNKEFNQYSKT